MQTWLSMTRHICPSVYPLPPHRKINLADIRNSWPILFLNSLVASMTVNPSFGGVQAIRKLEIIFHVSAAPDHNAPQHQSYHRGPWVRSCFFPLSGQRVPPWPLITESNVRRRRCDHRYTFQFSFLRFLLFSLEAWQAGGMRLDHLAIIFAFPWSAKAKTSEAAG